MTYILDRRGQGGQAAHILIVGVESYEGDEFEDLTGLAQAAIALGQWWVGAERRFLPPIRLESVRLLVSKDGGAVYPQENGGITLEPATSGNVRAAMEEWIRLSAEGSVGVLCWAGHGNSAGFGSSGILDTLFCSDQLDGRQLGISWSRTLNAINSLSGRAVIYCFLDSCRTEGIDPLDHDTGIRLGRTRNLAQRAFVHHSSAPGKSAWSYPDEIPAANFPGGPLGTCALLDALDRFGASDCHVGGRACSTASSLQEALDGLLERLVGWVAYLDGTTIAAGTDHVRGAHFSHPFMLVPSPHAMLDVLPSNGTMPKELSGEIARGASPGSPLTEAPRGLEAVMPHGLHQVTLFPVAGEDPKIMGLNAARPLHRIWHPGSDTGEP